MSKNKNNKPIWSTRIKKNSKSLYKKIGGSLSIDKRLFYEDIVASNAAEKQRYPQTSQIPDKTEQTA